MLGDSGGKPQGLRGGVFGDSTRPPCMLMNCRERAMNPPVFRKDWTHNNQDLRARRTESSRNMEVSGVRAGEQPEQKQQQLIEDESV